MFFSWETVRLKSRNKIYIPLTAGARGKKLTNRDFTIISNNCWGGTVYEAYDLPKLSPTVGMFIMPDDYVKFVSNLDYYLNQPLEFIKPEKSKWKKVLSCNSNWGKYLIGQLGDIELQMLHYHDEAEALRKWNDRIQRINPDKILYKFNDQNGAEKKHIQYFMKLPLEHKLCFVADEELCVHPDVLYIAHPKGNTGGVKASREPFGTTELTERLNSL